MTSAERACDDAELSWGKKYVLCNQQLSFQFLLLVSSKYRHTQKLYSIASIAYNRSNETSVEGVLEKEIVIVLNIDQIVCVRSLPRSKKGQEKGNASKDRKGGEPVKIIIAERVSSLSFVKTTVIRQVTM